MKYALGNMLNGAGGLNSDGLALDLQFATDKSLVARKGPTPTFTRASSGTFIGSNGLIQSSATNVARFDHDPVTLASRGLLIEESRTNLLLRSGELSNTGGWSTYQTSTASGVTAPDGTSTATTITENTANDSHIIQGAFSLNRPTTGAVTCIFSIYIQAGTRRFVSVGMSGGGGSAFLIVDTTSWAVTDAKSTGTGWTYISNQISNQGGGWYRVSLVATPPASTAVNCAIAGSFTSTSSTSFPVYTGTNSTFIAWGAQLEAGSFPTSYIPTTTTSIVRSADVCSITGTAFSGFYNNDQGTLISNARSLGVGVSQNPVVSVENGSSQILRIRHIGTTNRISAIVSGVSLSPSSGYDVIGVLYKSAISAGPSSADFVVNGIQIPDVYTGSSLTADNMKLSVSTAGLSNTCIASVQYYKKQLSVPKLQALTV